MARAHRGLQGAVGPSLTSPSAVVRATRREGVNFIFSSPSRLLLCVRSFTKGQAGQLSLGRPHVVGVAADQSSGAEVMTLLDGAVSDCWVECAHDGDGSRPGSWKRRRGGGARPCREARASGLKLLPLGQDRYARSGDDPPAWSARWGNSPCRRRSRAAPSPGGACQAPPSARS